MVRDDHASAVIRVPTWKDAIVVAAVSLYNIQTTKTRSADAFRRVFRSTHNLEDIDKVVATDGDEVGRVVRIAGFDDVDGAVFTDTEIHGVTRERDASISGPVLPCKRALWTQKRIRIWHEARCEGMELEIAG